MLLLIDSNCQKFERTLIRKQFSTLYLEFRYHNSAALDRRIVTVSLLSDVLQYIDADRLISLSWWT